MYFTGQFSHMELKCKHWLKKSGIKSGKLSVIKIYSGGKGRHRRNETLWGKCTLLHKPLEQKNKSLSMMYRANEGMVQELLFKKVLHWLPQETTTRQEYKKLPRFWDFDRSA
jgi:hypothetical protein